MFDISMISAILMYLLLILIKKCKGIMKWEMTEGRLAIPAGQLVQSVACGSHSAVVRSD